MVNIVIFRTSRDSYDIRESADCSMTVGELVNELKFYDYDDKIVFSNDNGYTYGIISRESLDDKLVETREEERERERREELEGELIDAREEMDEDLTDLQSRYENSEMTESEYNAEKAKIIAKYGDEFLRISKELAQ